MRDLWVQVDAQGQITICYLIALFVTVVIAKCTSVLSRRSARERLIFLIIAPALSIEPWRQATIARRAEVTRTLLKALVVFPALLAIYWWFPAAISQEWLPWPLRAYLAIGPFWLLTEGVALVPALAFVAAGVALPSIHDRPWRARSLTEFWGRRWNRPFADWFRQVCFNPLSRRPLLGMMIAFGLSRLMHEWLANLPLWIVLERNLFGSMLLYFLLQAGSIVVEKHWLRRYSTARRLLLWTFLLVPVPLVLNEATLRIFQLAG